MAGKEALNKKILERIESEYGCIINRWDHSTGTNLEILSRDRSRKLVVLGWFNGWAYADIYVHRSNNDSILYDTISHIDGIDDVYRLIERVVRL